MRTRSQAKAAMKRKAKPVPTIDAPEAAAGESLVGNFGPVVDADAVMVDAAAEEGAAVEFGMQVEGNALITGDAAIVDAGTVEGVAEASDWLYEVESAGMIEIEGDGDVSGENIGVPIGDGRKADMELEPGSGCLQSGDKAATKAVELSSCSPARHTEAEPKNSDWSARYCLPLDNGDFRVSDLVWSKLDEVSWWPGEIFDPSDASELALKHKKGNYPVAYFCNGTFAWRDKSQLMPFMTNYARMEKQCSSDDFINAVNHALEELSRRILSGMSCSCFSDELYDSGMSYLVDNQGLKDGVTCSTANKAEVLKYFHQENLLHYVKSLALFPGQGGDLLELVVACSQLTSLYRSKGCPELASFETCGGWDDNATDISSTMNVTMDSLNSFEDSVTTSHSSFKIGECKQQAASQPTGLSSVERHQNEPTHNGFGKESGDERTVLKGAKCRHMHENNNAEPKELLPQLCSVAIEPLNKKICSSAIISYFSYYKNYVVTASTEGNISGKDDSRRGQSKKVHSPEVECTDYMQDSYWFGLSLQDDSICSLERTCSSTRPRRKRKSSQESFVLPKKQIQVMERPIVHGDAKIADGLKPTALVLNFGRSAALPSEMDLIKVFSRYGPLKETETEVHKDANTAKVVFKKRLDAERGFSGAGKYGTFGPSLRSYRLVNMPFSLSV